MSSSCARPIVLLVEDSEDDAYFFRRALNQSRIACSHFHAADGAAALEYLQAAHQAPDDPQRPWPDVVFLDVKLPTFSAFEILEWLRERRLLPRLEVSVLSGSENASDIARARELGATVYLVKPVSTEQLRERLAQWIEQHSTGAANQAPVLPGRS